MTRLNQTSNVEMRKKIMAIVTLWVEMCSVVSWFLTLVMTASSLSTYRPRFRSYSLYFYAKREYKASYA